VGKKRPTSPHALPPHAVHSWDGCQPVGMRLCLAVSNITVMVLYFSCLFLSFWTWCPSFTILLPVYMHKRQNTPHTTGLLAPPRAQHTATAPLPSLPCHLPASFLSAPANYFPAALFMPPPPQMPHAQPPFAILPHLAFPTQHNPLYQPVCALPSTQAGTWITACHGTSLPVPTSSTAASQATLPRDRLCLPCASSLHSALGPPPCPIQFLIQDCSPSRLFLDTFMPAFWTCSMDDFLSHSRTFFKGLVYCFRAPLPTLRTRHLFYTV